MSVTPAALSALRSRIAGRVVVPDDDDYELVREVFNHRCAGRPLLIVQCASLQDVRTALAWAGDTGIDLAVRGGGHSIAGWSSLDDGLVIDLSLMRDVDVDPVTRTAWVGAGVRAIDVLETTSELGLAAVTGATPEVGLGGLLLGLGEGYLSPKHGFGVDNVIALEVVTANGQVVEASDRDHPELFWAMRGAGANFGVVTRMKLQLHPLPERAVGGSLTFDHTQLEPATRQVWSIMADGSHHFWPYAVYELDRAGLPQLRVIPGHTGPSALAAEELESLRRSALVEVDSTETMSYLSLVRDMGAPSSDPARPRRHAWHLYRFPFTHDAGPQVSRLLDLASSLTPTAQFVLWRTVPKTSVTPPGVAPRRAGITICLSDSWHDASEDDDHLSWCRETAMRLTRDGVADDPANAANHAPDAEGERVRRVFGEHAYARLAALKARLDPENRFHHNFNVPPAHDDQG